MLSEDELATHTTIEDLDPAALSSEALYGPLPYSRTVSIFPFSSGAKPWMVLNVQRSVSSPFKKLTEQSFSFFRANGAGEARLILSEELFELIADIARSHCIAVPLKPLLRRPETNPSRQRCAERYFLPFRVEWRLLQLADLAEEGVHEAREPTIAFCFRCPIEGRQHGGIAIVSTSSPLGMRFG